MQFTISAAALAAFAGSVVAQNPNFNPVYRPESGEEVQSGTTFTIEWEAPAEFADVEISISLIGGATQDTQVPLLDIASGITNSDERYEWTIPEGISGENFYGLRLQSLENPDDWQYSNPFVIVAGDGEPTGADESSTAVTTTLTTSLGTATIHLSEAIPSTSEAPIPIPVPVNTTSSVHVPRPTSEAPVETLTVVPAPPVQVSSSVPVAPPVVTATTAVEGTPAQPSEPAEEDDVVEAAAPRQVQAGAFALVGGLVVALML